MNQAVIFAIALGTITAVLFATMINNKLEADAHIERFTKMCHEADGEVFVPPSDSGEYRPLCVDPAWIIHLEKL